MRDKFPFHRTRFGKHVCGILRGVGDVGIASRVDYGMQARRSGCYSEFKAHAKQSWEMI